MNNIFLCEKSLDFRDRPYFQFLEVQEPNNLRSFIKFPHDDKGNLFSGGLRINVHICEVSSAQIKPYLSSHYIL